MALIQYEHNDVLLVPLFLAGHSIGSPSMGAPVTNGFATSGARVVNIWVQCSFPTCCALAGDAEELGGEEYSAALALEQQLADHRTRSST